MEKIVMLGTGAAMVRNIYNTCFCLTDESGECFLVDGGGGNGIFVQLHKAGIEYAQIRNAFISHNHSDHLLGLVWMVRAITQQMVKDRYTGNFNIYGHRTSLDAIRTICGYVMQPKLNALFDKRVIMNEIEDNTELDIDGRHFHFFNIQSTKMLQHGFVCTLHNGKRLAFAGDEPINKANYDLIRGSEIVMQEAYCAYSDVEKFRPYEKSHGTVKDSCEKAQELGAQLTILFHTEDVTPIAERKEKYTQEGQRYFSGKLFVPNDLEEIGLDF